MSVGLSSVDFMALSPLLVLLTGALLLLVVEILHPVFSRRFSASLAALILLGGLFAQLRAPASDNPLLTDWLRFDALARFFTLFFLLTGLACTWLGSSFFSRFEASHGEYFFLLISATLGLILIGAAADFLTLFLGLETLSISLYVLCGYMKGWQISREAAIKYFLLGSVGASFLLYGIAFFYGALGTTRLSALAAAPVASHATAESTLLLVGLLFVTVGLAFKAAIVPFHVWAPDVYAGAPTPVTAFMTVGTKVGAFAALARLFLQPGLPVHLWWSEGMACFAYPTLIFANFLALRQTGLRRFFAYSGISHSGFLLIPLVAGTADALPALGYYLVVYALATLGAFAVLSFVDPWREGARLADLRGLFRRAPLLASALALCLLTLAGIPPTAGFLGKFYLFKVGFEAGYYGLVIVALLTAILAAYYYLRFVAVMFSEPPDTLSPLPRSWPAGGVALASAAALVVLSFYSKPLMALLLF